MKGLASHVSMWVSQKDPRHISLDVSVRKGSASHLSPCVCQKRTHIIFLSMWVSRMDSRNISVDVCVTKGLALHLSRCRCHERTHIISLSLCGCDERSDITFVAMWVSRKYSHRITLDVVVRNGLKSHFFSRGCHESTDIRTVYFT